ncbi:hypothetical protein SAMN02745131_01924 [Flavisolibacter ginsengisoli DSM 18119]|jgi:hypothetical protein|uniref:Surface antigen n=1 Tax=Flavisolibacter ginsengisoli DSM 18119 TaxID=1121884 RepID=A0A1M4ZFP3_9BACT|nr:hypothetical protein SAMN02745131_01924 [Flavisolibacter ginsengisoli DSM 18119]
MNQCSFWIGCRVKFLSQFILLLTVSLISFQAFSQSKEKIKVAIAPEYDDVSGAHRFLFGESYRKLWAAPVTLKVFYLGKEKGGLRITGKGGGLQTKSLRLVDNTGREWVLRSVQKYPERALPKKLRATIAKDILQDQVVTSHPYAALTVPPFAEALGILHTNPQIVFVPDDPALGQYRKDFANTVLLFEEREPDGVPDTDNTDKAQGKAEEDNDVKFDQKKLLRARLLDHFLGDWDRHEDQWRWEKNKTGEEVLYEPIPRDRDKVYYTTSGLLPGLLSTQPGKANLQPFGDHIKKIGSYNYNNRFFDRYFLNDLSEEDWREQVSFVQNTLTDSLIRYAVSMLPDTIYALSANKIIQTLIARRATLKETALDYYHFLARTVDIPASDKAELFDLQVGETGKVDLSIYKNPGEVSRGDLLFHRVFLPSETDEIRLFGLGGDDVYQVHGSTKTSIRIHMIGGDGVDSFFIDPLLHNRRRMYIYDRADQPNKLPSSKFARLRTSTDSTINEFDRKSFLYDHTGPVISAQYDLDLGFIFKAGMVYERQGFRKVFYAKRHSFFVNYAPARQSFMVQYNGDYKKLFGKNDLSINLQTRGPHNIATFFGIGNESPFVNKDGQSILYYRNRYDVASGDVRIHRSPAKIFEYNAGFGFQYYNSEQKNNLTQFLSEFSELNPSQQVFSRQFFAGLVGGARINSKKETLIPSKGFFWNMDWKAMKQLGGDHKWYGQVVSEAILYLPIISDNIVLANRVGAGTSIGQPAYYQQLQLGGYNNLRGFYVNRFTGRSMFYHNLELRAKLFDFTSYLFPGSVGIMAFNDEGRVWVPGEHSQQWHHGYGGGLFIIPADLVLIQASIANSKEGIQPYVSLGLSF